jgi:antirestriction protein ArdC
MRKKVNSEKFLQENLKDHHKNLTDLIIKKMEEAVKYQKPWFVCELLPYNPETGTKYKGINVISLMSRGFNDPRFLTFKNIQTLSEKTGEKILIKKGEKGIPVFKAIKKVFKKVEEETGEETSFSIWNQIYAGTVFNASQLVGMPPLTEVQKIDFTEEIEAEKIVTAMKELTGLKLEHSAEGRAYYQYDIDKVHMPNKENFKSVALYYRTLMHEIGHATGHESRLNRKFVNKFGSPEYAFEELVAELSSYFMGATLGLPYDPQTHENHAAYLKSWINALKKDKNMIFKAAAQATRSVEFQLKTKAIYYGEINENETEFETEINNKEEIDNKETKFKIKV